MLEFLCAPQNFPFAIALAVMLILAMLEGIGVLLGVGALLGGGLSEVVDSFLPEMDIDCPEGDFDFALCGPDPVSPTPMEWAFSFVRLPKVPVLVLFIVFLLLFGIFGLLLQDLMLTYWGYMLSPATAAVATFALTIPMTMVAGHGLARILPKDETSAVSRDSFVGKTAKLVLGVAKQGYPARAKVRDCYGKAHYLMVEPEDPKDSFKQGEVVRLVKRDGARFHAIRSASTTTKECNL